MLSYLTSLWQGVRPISPGLKAEPCLARYFCRIYFNSDFFMPVFSGKLAHGPPESIKNKIIAPGIFVHLQYALNV